MGDPRKHCSIKCPRLNLDIGSPRLRGKGSRKAKILLVGEAPGQSEDIDGTPFVGSSGELLDDVLTELDINRKDIYITNAVKCATPVENKKPGKKEITACRRYLLKEIEVIKPNVIGCLGAIALEAVLKRKGITKLQNNVFQSEELQTKVVPVLHPAYILRNPGEYDNLLKGMLLIKQESRARERVVLAKTKTKWIDADTPKKIDKVLEQLENVDAFAFDVETTSLDPLIAKILLMALSWQIGLGVTIKWDRLSQEQKDRLQKIFISKKEKIGQNLKYDVQVLWVNNFRVKGPYFDTLPAIALIDENIPKKTLEVLTLRYLDLGEYWAPLDEFKAKYMKEHKIKKEDFNYGMIPYNILCTYAQGDADATYRLYVIFKKELIKQNLMDFYKKYTLPTLKILMRIERKGIKINRKKLKKIIKEYQGKVVISEKDIKTTTEVKKYQKIRFAHVSKQFKEKWEKSKTLRSRSSQIEYLKARVKKKDWKFNPKSSKQLRELLFDMLKLPVTKLTKTKQACTDASVLTILANSNQVEIAQKIITNRKLTKFLSTYLVSVYNKSKIDGRVHPSYMQHRAVTGRLSSENPNFQNIKRDAIEFKKCFLADPGMVILRADLAQAEFRCWAHYSNDQKMIHDIESGMDIHRKTASEIFGVPEDEVTKEQREAAKNCVAGDTWIPTITGFRKIATIKKGDIVLDHYNRPQKVKKTINKKDTMYVINTECGSLKCTKDHPFYILDQNANLITKTLSTLSTGDYILSCTPKNLQKKYVTWKYTGEKRTSFKPIFKKWKLNSKLGYLIGFIIAEGSISSKLGHKNVSWVQKGRFVEVIDKVSTEIFGDRVKRYTDKRTRVVTWKVSSLEFVEFLKYVGMCTDNKKGFKSFPDKMMESPPCVQKAFLQGYFLGDGTFKNHIACVGTVSKELRDGVCLLLRSFGIYPKVFIEHPKKGSDFYNIHITTQEELKILINTIKVSVPKNWTYPKQNNGRKFLHNINDLYKLRHPDADTRYNIKIRKHLTHLFLKKRCPGVNKTVDKLIDHGIYSVRINSIKKLKKDTVYDFVTTGDKTMIANGFFSLDCVFGLMFGRGTKSISEQYGISRDDADAIRDLFFKTYPMAALWLDKQVAFVQTYGFVKTWLGRVRRLPEIHSDDHMVKAEAERQTKNSPIQGLASDMNNHFMVMNLKFAKKKNIYCYPMGTIHDANYIQVRESDVDRLIEVMTKVVNSSFPGFRCKMALDFEVGKTLGTLKGV